MPVAGGSRWQVAASHTGCHSHTQVGLELEEPLGKHDGTIKEETYFTCRDKYVHATLACIRIYTNSQALPPTRTPTRTRTPTPMPTPTHHESGVACLCGHRSWKPLINHLLRHQVRACACVCVVWVCARARACVCVFSHTCAQACLRACPWMCMCALVCLSRSRPVTVTAQT